MTLLYSTTGTNLCHSAEEGDNLCVVVAFYDVDPTASEQMITKGGCAREREKSAKSGKTTTIS